MAFRLALEFSPKVLRLSLLRLNAFFSRADFILLTRNLTVLLKAKSFAEMTVYTKLHRQCLVNADRGQVESGAQVGGSNGREPD
jgi:hypothetical protein